MIYITDGSFEGILTAIFEAFLHKEEPENIVSREQYQISMVTGLRDIETSQEKSDRVYKAIVDKMSNEVIEVLYRAYLHEHPDVGIAIYRYIRIGLKIGRKVISYLQNPDILRVNDMSQKVLTEINLFLGILRFKKLKNGIYYAKFEPDNNITMLLSNHFAERLSDQPWIIHDTKRDIYALYDTIQVVFSNEHLTIPEDIIDEKFEILWKKYFKAIAIESRMNPKLQKQFMPRRYWGNLTEKQSL